MILSSPQCDPAFPEKFVRHVYASRANLVIAQIQDVLGLDDTARMNYPGTEDILKNWTWRVTPKQLSAAVAQLLQTIATAHQRYTDSSQ